MLPWHFSIQLQLVRTFHLCATRLFFVGRILNRFSKDQNAIDEQLLFAVFMFLTQAFTAIGVVAVVASVTPFFLGILIPLGMNNYLNLTRVMLMFPSSIHILLFTTILFAFISRVTAFGVHFTIPYLCTAVGVFGWIINNSCC